MDLVLRESGETTLVQCKHWNSQQVGVSFVRELHGVMNGEVAEPGVIVTGGAFTADAEAFARGKGIELVNGAKLAALLNDARGETRTGSADATTRPTEPNCPKCGSSMVRRTARRGANAGERFLGLQRVPWLQGNATNLAAR